MSTRIAAFFAVVLFASAAFAQVVYLPVQYQFGPQQPYYYVGNDPHVFAMAEHDAALLAFRPVEGALPRVYSDLFPFANAYIFGFRPSDAYNQAYQSVPRYFVKRDLLETGLSIDGTLIVPPTPPRARPIVHDTFAAPAPAAERKGVILIIPRKPAPQQVGKPAMFVSAAR